MGGGRVQLGVEKQCLHKCEKSMVFSRHCDFCIVDKLPTVFILHLGLVRTALGHGWYYNPHFRNEEPWDQSCKLTCLFVLWEGWWVSQPGLSAFGVNMATTLHLYCGHGHSTRRISEQWWSEGHEPAGRGLGEGCNYLFDPFKILSWNCIEQHKRKPLGICQASFAFVL